MNSHRRSIGAFAVAVASLSVPPTFAQSTTRVSVSSAGVQGDGASGTSNGSGTVKVSADRRFVAFESRATNLVVGDTNACGDIFVHDRTNGATTRVSVSSTGSPGNADSDYPAISADGRFVAFESDASNLVPGDMNGRLDIFVRDRLNGTTERVSMNWAGMEVSSPSSFASISADGRFVAFQSSATNLVAGDTNGYLDVFVRDRWSGTLERADVTAGGAQANYGARLPSISADGRFVVFASLANNLVAGDTNGLDVFVRDRTSATTERISLDSAGVQGDGDSDFASISADGRFVVFRSLASNLVAGDTNGVTDVFLRDRVAGTTARFSIDPVGAQGNSASGYPSISADGRCVTFRSLASNLVASDTNGWADVFVRTLLSGTTERASVDTVGVQGDSFSDSPSISDDGRHVAFRSKASNLVAGDTNGVEDIFVRDRGPAQPASYCTSSTSSNGCIASIAANANPSVSLANACNLSVANVEGVKSGLLFYGIDNSAFVPGPWAPSSSSWLCVKSPTPRTPIQNSGGTLNACDGSFVLDWNAYQSANPVALGNPWNAGDKVYAQAWFRDPLAVKSTNLSNALEMIYVP